MISVCIATYNGERYLREQVDSILVQLGTADELIVSDDGSTDSTLSILESYGDSRIRIFANTNRKGVIGNFENALKQAKGEYIFLSDQDDVWLPGKVEKCVEALQQADLALHDATIIDADGNLIAPSFFALRNTRKGFWANLKKNGFIGCCMAFRREMLEKTLPFPPQIAIHDMWIGLLASRKGKVNLVDEPLILYRRHEENASSTGEKSGLSLKEKTAYRLRMWNEIRKR